ncbi:MAG: hypothetical protein II997_04830 [Clostridia bacterium]|nr:hypothetical protein [Clostridia bacterium]
MLYKKSQTKKLDMELFKHPTAEYRGTPFWSWNCVLEKDMLMRQIEYLKEMGFGGFHMHSRSGMATEYLSEEFMNLVKACRDKAEKEEMLAWLYDEDRWPSGSAGGYVTKTKAYRQKILMFSVDKVDFVEKEEGVREGKPYLLAVYDIVLDEKGCLKSYEQINEEDEASGCKWYAYVMASPGSGWYNGESYVDTLSKEAIREFISITHEQYKENVGESFGTSVPAIFTDEPQFEPKGRLPFAESRRPVGLPWTTDLPETYMARYGEDVLKTLPEILWDLPADAVSQPRYRYHDHICERFVEAFVDQCGDWCEKNGIALTGHMMCEPTLSYQTEYIGEAMRAYRSFQIPGIDMLCDRIELTTAKQAQSVAHQDGREGVMSELYGVTNWDFDFRGHKFQGDWQAALGVTVRVPHLSWVSMKGSAKRDYPASINYQSPWYKEYSYVEDHYARLNTVLTRGKPVVKVGVIHPIESFWLHYGPANTSFEMSNAMDENFLDFTKWMLTGMVDFDFISESLLPEQCGEITRKLSVGKMQYETIVVPNCETLRKTTFDILKAFKEKNGRVLFVGECPKYIDALPSDEVQAFYQSCEHCENGQIALLRALKQERTAELVDAIGESVHNMLHAFREDGDVKWLFLAHCDKELKYIRHYKQTATPTDTPVREAFTIILNGSYIPKLYDTVAGTVSDLTYEVKNGKTYIQCEIYQQDSLLIRLTEGTGSFLVEKPKYQVLQTIDFKDNVAFCREEDNVYLLDMAEYKLDEADFQPKDVILRLDDECRKVLGYPEATGREEQPWVLGPDKISHYITLRFKVKSSYDVPNTYIAGEEAEWIRIDGKEIDLTPVGYYVDESIKKYVAGALGKGEHIIEIKTPIGKRTSVENYYLLGNFDVDLRGCEAEIIPPKKTVGFGDLTRQGMPFYGGNLTYKTKIYAAEDCRFRMRVSRYRGACVKVFLDGEEQGYIAYAPNLLEIPKVTAGEHELEFKIFGNRINTFGDVHNCSYTDWFGPGAFYAFHWKYAEHQKGIPEEMPYTSCWTYEYNLKPFGILSSPVVQLLNE